MSDNILWAPWRAGFVKGPKEKGCVFCNRLKQKDSVSNLIVHRGERCFVILNKFPYNSGHAMVIPLRHVGNLEQLKANEVSELMALTQTTVRLLKSIVRPSSFNLGMNLGKSSGAGVPGHLHMHIVPRWIGDTNFMPVVGKTKVVSVPLEDIYHALRAAFASI